MDRADFVAGISVAGLMLPEAVAYAGIAGLPPQQAIFAAIAGSLIYPLVGRSRFAIVSPTSSSAAILAAALGTLAAGNDLKLVLASTAVALVGFAFILAGWARLGALTGFISRPVLRGFSFGLAITIILKQIPLLVGANVHAASLFGLVADLAISMPRWHMFSLLTGGLALVALLALRRFPLLPGAFVVLVAGIAASLAFDLPRHGVATVGRIDVIPSLPAFQIVPTELLAPLAHLVLPLVLILFAESWGTMRALALRHGDTIDPKRELCALGFANLGSALLQGMPVGAGFSAGSACETAGAKSRATSIVAAVGLALLVFLATPLIAALPEPVLAAVVIAALTHALDPRPILRLWRLDRDQYVAAGAAAGVLVLGVLNGMLFAILLSVAALIRRLATPQIARLGRLGTSHNFVDLARHPEALVIPDVAIWRAAEPLFFANAERVLAAIASGRGSDAAHILIVSLEESFDLDSTALDALIEFDTRLRKQGTTLHLARVRDHIRDLMIASDAADLSARCHYSVEDAVAAVSRPATGQAAK